MLNTLIKIVKRPKKRLGLGHGSGRSKTSGRGTKGQKARRTIALSFEGGALPLIKRMPFLRGKNRNNPFTKNPVIINLDNLSSFSKGAVVDVASLVKQKVVKEREVKKNGVKLLGDGELTIALTVKIPVSNQAKGKIEKAGGTVESL
ncbi:MAG TPA: 50S ribosomal protein L15 [Candidatus Eisenbacteria bacterium]|nr:50S ribosomal protein L15 [Candidatus Eisenbacteria bacterium]